MPSIPRPPAAGAGRSLFAGRWPQASAHCHSLVARLMARQGRRATALHQCCGTVASRGDLRLEAMAVWLDVERETIRRTRWQGKQHLRAVLDAHVRVERG
jgi:hypothetical protein